MLSTYLTIAIRSLQKNALFTLINVLGLCAGIIVFILIAEYVSFERSYNQFHAKLPDLYRVIIEKDGDQISAYNAPGFAPIAVSKISGIETYCRVAEGTNLGTGVINFQSPKTNAENSFRENNFIYADANFFDFFTFPMVNGDAQSLGRPNTVALSLTTSKKYFGAESPLGKTLTLNNQFGKTIYTIEMVYADMPENSDLRYDLVFSIETLKSSVNLNGNEMWASMDGTGSQWLYTYLQLNPKTNKEIVEQEYSGLVAGANPEEKSVVYLQPVSKLHLGESLDEKLPTFGNLKSVYILSGIGILILIIAWVNYINLSTANALKRAKEVGVRKVVGASRSQLITQFIGESALLNAIAFVLALVVVSAVQKPFADFIGKNISLEMLDTSFWLIAIFSIGLGALCSSAYAAFVLSSFNPANVLKGIFSKSAAGVALRKSLVVLQFSISTILIVVTVVVFQQWQYMATKDLGLDASQLLVVRGAEVNKDETFQDRSAAFEEAIRNAAFVQEFCRSGNVPADGYNFSTSGITRLNSMPDDEKTTYDILTIDDRYFETYSIAMMAGNPFTPEMCSKGWNEMQYVIINESAAQSLGFSSPADAIDQKVKWDGRELTVRGVVKNYHHLAVQYSIGPILFLPASKGGYYTLKLNTKNFSQSLSSLEQSFKKSFPGNPFEYNFLDETFARKYRLEQEYSIIFTLAACLTIFIASLGLFGLASYSVEQRTKEIGIRKVLGSSTSQIVTLFSKDFIVLVVIAFVIAAPLSWWLLDRWLQGFSYRIAISWEPFVLSGVVTIVIAFLTVGSQAFKGAISNPAISLRTD